jgi:hypothetical protein
MLLVAYPAAKIAMQKYWSLEFQSVEVARHPAFFLTMLKLLHIQVTFEAEFWS